MKEQSTKAAARVSAGGIGEIANQGVERALAARSAVVLSDEQAGQVGGGATLSPALMIPIIAGGRPIDIFGTRPGGEIFSPKTLGGAAGALTLGV